MKKILLMFLIIALSNCSGYITFDNDTDVSAQKLAVIEGGTLSLKGSDQISPFLFRDTNFSNPVLFYASDQNGNFDIFYSLMDETTGQFHTPHPLGNIVNSGAQETHPYVFWYYDYFNFTNKLFISFIRNDSTNKILMTVALDSVFSNKFLQQGITNSGISGIVTINQANGMAGQLAVNFSNGYSTNFQFDLYPPSIGWSYPSVKYFGSQYVTGGSGLKQSVEGTAEFYLLNTEILGKNQLLLYEYLDFYGLSSNYVVTNEFVPPQYSSIFKDKDPFVDFIDPNTNYTVKVYFSSDRQGDFDLYRYNEYTYNVVSARYPLSKWAEF